MINRIKEQDKVNLLIIDIGCLIISFITAFWIRFGITFDSTYKISYGFILILLILCYLCILALNDFYAGIYNRGFFDEFINVVKSNVILALIVSAILFYFKMGAIYSRVFFISFFLTNVLMDYVVRQYFKVILLAYYKKSVSSNKVMIITTSDQARSIINRMREDSEWEFQVTSFAILDKDMVGEAISGIPVVANNDNLLDVATKSVVDEVFISIPREMQINITETILKFENIGITVNLGISTFNLNVNAKTIKNFGSYSVLSFSTKVFNKGYMILKRAVDIIGAIVGLCLTLVISIIIVPAILIESPGPIIFSQTRIGKNGRRFKIYKFRSMYADAEARKKELLEKNEMKGLMFKLENDPRITKVGNFIRKTSIDELPQFFNVLKGDMSLVGTRPPTEDEFLQYEGRHKRRLSLKPGITGLWQVSGRSEIVDFEDVVRLDLEYIDHWSLMQDVKLLLKTVFVVVFRVGAK